MKLTCDLCGGKLRVEPGGQSARCTECGLGYTMERLREKLGLQTPRQPEPEEPVAPVAPAAPEPVEDIPEVEAVEDVEEPVSAADYDFSARQFVMDHDGCGAGDLTGLVAQGGIGLGDYVYINNDYVHPYVVYSINDDPSVVCAKAGQSADLYLANCPSRVLRKAQRITGIPDPEANAYNYPGTAQEYFSHLLPEAFGEYEVVPNVPHPFLKTPIDYLFYRDGRPVLAVFLVHSNDSKARYQAQKAVAILGKVGIACTHFFENYRTDMSYVIDRIRAAMNNKTSADEEPAPRKQAAPARQPETIILDVVSTKKRPGFAYGQAICRVRQGTVECGMPYRAYLNALDGTCFQVGSLESKDISAGGTVKILPYCDKTMLPTMRTLYLVPIEDGE